MTKRNANAPTMEPEAEETLVRRQGALKQLGAKVRRMTLRCATCGNVYLAGSRHRGSAWCTTMTLRRQLFARKLDSISVNYLDWLRELDVGFEVHRTALRPVRGEYNGLGNPDKRVWIPAELAHLLTQAKLPKKKRLAHARELLLAARERWAAQPTSFPWRFADGRAALDRAVAEEHREVYDRHLRDDAASGTQCHCVICQRLRATPTTAQNRS